MNTAAHSETTGTTANAAAPSELDSMAGERDRLTVEACDPTDAAVTDAYMRRGTWRLVAFAAVAGVAVGYLLSRRRNILHA